VTFVVDVPPNRESERRYILDVVLGDWLGLSWRMRVQERRDVRISAGDGVNERCLTMPDVLFDACGPAWLSMASLPSTPLATVSVPGGSPIAGSAARSGADRRVPVVFGRTGARAAPPSPGLHLDVDVLGSAFFMLTRYEEAVLRERDRFDRFPAAASLAARAGFLEVPVVDAYVELLWEALRRLWPGLRRRARHYQVLLSHDVDDPISTFGRRRRDLARQLAADVLVRRSPGLAARRSRSLLRRCADHASDPHNTFDFLMDESEARGLSSAFYFQSHAAPDVAGGANYALHHPWIRRLLRRVHERGHEIGYHAGFGTYLDAGRTSAEFARLRSGAEREGVRQDEWGGRQHYLQWAAPATWRNWEAAGLSYDCSVAYADAIGFRTGTCHEYRVFDVVTGTPLQLRERPLQVMDVTLFGYMGLDAPAARDAVGTIAAGCRRYGGSLGVLWHNDSLLRTAREKRWYTELLDVVTDPGTST